MAIKRVCIALSEENKEYADSQIKKTEPARKNRSKVINSLIDERRQDEKYNNRQNSI